MIKDKRKSIHHRRDRFGLKLCRIPRRIDTGANHPPLILR
jgi:hypothetical protein